MLMNVNHINCMFLLKSVFIIFKMYEWKVGKIVNKAVINMVARKCEHVLF